MYDGCIKLMEESMKQARKGKLFVFVAIASMFVLPVFAWSKTDVTPLLDEAKKLMDQGNYDDALAKCGEAIEKDKNSAKAYLLRGTAYTLKGNYDLALEDTNKAIELDAGDSDAYVARGNVYYNQTKDDLALADYDKAISLKSDNAEAYYRRGKLHEVRSEFDAAIDDYQKSLSINPKNLSLHDGLVYIFNNQKKYAQTVEATLKAIEAFPEDSLFRKNLGDAYVQLGQWENALAAYANAMKLSSTYEVEYYGTEAVLYQKKGEAQKALKSYSLALEKGKGSGSSNLALYAANRGFLNFDLKKYEDALVDFQDAVIANAGSSQAYLGLAMSYHKLKLAKLTRKAMDKALELEPGLKDIDTFMSEKDITFSKGQLEAIKGIVKQFGY